MTLAIVTWNMHRDAGDLPRLTSDLADGRLTVVPPDDYVLMLQEAPSGGRHDPATVAQDRQLAIVYQPLRVLDSLTSGNAIVSTLPLEPARLIDLPRVRQHRGAIATALTLAGTRLFVVTTHLENRRSVWRGLLFSDTSRGRQARALIADLPDGPGVLGGDLNTWLGPAEPAWKAFAARFPNPPDERPEPTVRDRLPLDHLFFDVPDGWRVERRVLPEGYGSDHRPVIGVISVSS